MTSFGERYAAGYNAALPDRIRVEVRWITGGRILLQVGDRWHLVLSPVSAEDVAAMLLVCVRDSIADAIEVPDHDF